MSTSAFRPSTSNDADDFDVELRFGIPFHESSDPVRVIIPSKGTVQGCDISPIPPTGTPRSEQWCREYGVISKDLLSHGIVEKRDDGTLVVYRKFRHSPNRLTPFGVWSGRCPTVHSSSGLTVYTEEEYRSLERACCGTPCNELTITAVPLLSKKYAPSELADAKVDIHLHCPAVLSSTTGSPPPTGPDEMAKEDANLIILDPEMYAQDEVQTEAVV